MSGLPVASALSSAYESAVSSTSDAALTGDFDVMTCPMNRCLLSTSWNR